MESQFDLEPDRKGRKAVPAERSAEMPEPMRVASQIGNQAVQRVATTPALQRSPAAAGLAGGRALARQEDEEPEAAPTEEPAAAEAAGTEGADAAAAESAPAEGATEGAAPAEPGMEPEEEAA
jgi:hypothetical protein